MDSRRLKSRGVGSLHVDHHRLRHKSPLVCIIVLRAINRIDGISVVGLVGVGNTAQKDLPQLAIQVVDFLDHRSKELLIDIQHPFGVGITPGIADRACFNDPHPPFLPRHAG